MAELRCSDGTVVQISAETEAKLRKAFEPKHVWKHGDVFDEGDGVYPKIYIHVDGEKPQVFHLSGGMFTGTFGCGDRGLPAFSEASSYTNFPQATFLFNIKDKL